MDKDSPVIHLLLSKTGGVEDEMVTRPRRISALDCPHLLGDDARAGDGGGIIKVECNVRYTALLIKSGRVLFMFVRMLVDLSIAVFYASLIDTYYCDLQLMRNMYVCMYVCMYVIFIEYRRNQLCQQDLKFMYVCRGQLGLSSIEGLSSDCSAGQNSFQKHVSVVSTTKPTNTRNSDCSSIFTVVALPASQLYGCRCDFCKVGSTTESTIKELQARKVSESLPVEEPVQFKGMISMRWSLLLSCR